MAPKAVVLLSGKRKSGKDFVSEMLFNKLGSSNCSILRLSGPLKAQYAKEHGLDFDRLLDASEYKEKYRAAMIPWGEEKRKQDPGFFCRLATSGHGSEKDVWIISDARRLTDVQYFEDHYCHCLIKVRIYTDEAIREKRGFIFTKGVDDVESECGLDSGVEWTVVINNNGDNEQLQCDVDGLLSRIASLSH